MARLSLAMHPEAVEEAQAALGWYRSQSIHAAKAFLAELDAGIERICTAPEIYPRHLGETRCYRLRRFPYLVIYRATSADVHVYAVAHNRRRPGYWKERTSR